MIFWALDMHVQRLLTSRGLDSWVARNGIGADDPSPFFDEKQLVGLSPSKFSTRPRGQVGKSPAAPPSLLCQCEMDAQFILQK